MATQTIDPEIVKLLEAGTLQGNVYRLPVGQLDRKTYEAANKVLTGLGAKWDKKARAHVAGDHSDLKRLTEVLASGKRVDLRQETQFFATPRSLVARLLALAELRRGMNALEPSAGTGNIAIPLLERLGPGSVLVCENHEPFLPDLQAAGMHFLGRDFLAVDPEAENVAVDRVVMNPPFTRGTDVRHVTHALRFLRPGGRLVSVMSPSWRFKQDKASEPFRSLVERSGMVVDVPAGTFRESGTDIATVIVVLEAA